MQWGTTSYPPPAYNFRWRLRGGGGVEQTRYTGPRLYRKSNWNEIGFIDILVYASSKVTAVLTVTVIWHIANSLAPLSKGGSTRHPLTHLVHFRQSYNFSTILHAV